MLELISNLYEILKPQLLAHGLIFIVYAILFVLVSPVLNFFNRGKDVSFQVRAMRIGIGLIFILHVIDIALIVALIVFFWMGIRIAKNSNDKFSKMTAIGIVFWITLQAFINISSAAGIFPLAGIPLPFFSYGGSHLTVELIGIGLLLNISKNT